MKKKIIATMSISALALTMFGGVANAAPGDVESNGKVEFIQATDEVSLEMVRPGTNKTIERIDEYGKGGKNTAGNAKFTNVPVFDFGVIRLGKTSYVADSFNSAYQDLVIKSPTETEQGEKRIIPHFIQVLDMSDTTDLKVEVKMDEFIGADTTEIQAAAINIYGQKVYNNGDNSSTVVNAPETDKLTKVAMANGTTGNEYIEIEAGGSPVTLMQTDKTKYQGSSVSSVVFSKTYDPSVADAVMPAALTNDPSKDDEYVAYTKENRNKDVKLSISDATGLKKQQYSSKLTWSIIQTP